MKHMKRDEKTMIDKRMAVTAIVGYMFVVAILVLMVIAFFTTSLPPHRWFPINPITP